MFRYHYFVKQVNIPYSYVKKFQCIRIPEGDSELPNFRDLYRPVGWDIVVTYPYAPSKDNEQFKLKATFRAWDCEFEIQSLEEHRKDIEMS